MWNLPLDKAPAKWRNLVYVCYQRSKWLGPQTRHIIPVELNSYLCRNAKIMEKFHTILGNSAKAQEYTTTFERFKNSIDEVLWNDTLGAYFDYKIGHKEQNTAFYPSNVAPLWANCYL